MRIGEERKSCRLKSTSPITYISWCLISSNQIYISCLHCHFHKTCYIWCNSTPPQVVHNSVMGYHIIRFLQSIQSIAKFTNVFLQFFITILSTNIFFLFSSFYVLFVYRTIVLLVPFAYTALLQLFLSIGRTEICYMVVLLCIFYLYDHLSYWQPFGCFASSKCFVK